MNYKMIAYIIGWVMKIEAAFLILPFLVACIYGEAGYKAFLVTILLCFCFGCLLSYKKPEDNVLYTREGYVSVALCWIAMSVMGALPFLLTGAITDPVDALFETVSGFTTTGASILADVEVLPKCVLFWRSFTHWIGGMGVLVFLLMIFPAAGGSHMNLMKAESPGPSVSKFVPKVRTTAKILYGIYICMSILQVCLLLLGRMPFFDAVTTMFGTAGTGGFGIKNDSMAGYSSYIQIVTTVFMILFGINFNVYFLLLAKKLLQAVKVEEMRWYLGIITAAVLFIAWNISGMFRTAGEALQQSAFQVASIITTTGFSTTDFDIWPQASRTILVMLMFVGACAGSTGGGIKVSRFVILLKTVNKELHQFIHPHGIKKVKMDGKTVEHEVVRSTNVFMVAYILIFAFSILILAMDEKDLITNFTAVAATFNNIGPGLGLVGPTSNFSIFSDPAKVVLTFDMLAGRLEIFPILLLGLKDTWKRY